MAVMPDEDIGVPVCSRCPLEKTLVVRPGDLVEWVCVCCGIVAGRPCPHPPAASA